MKIYGVRFTFIAGGIIVALGALSFSLAAILSTDGSFSPCDGGSLLGRMLGESRHAIGDSFCEEADRYFHHGVPHKKKTASIGFMQRLADEVQLRDPEHLSGDEVHEMMPWLRFATRMDPHNMDAYLSAAFWVVQENGENLPQAMEILDEARRNNPSDYRVPLQRGLIFLQYGDRNGAAQSFDVAMRLWSHTDGANPEQKRIDLAALFNYRGFLYELDGRTDKALAYYRKHLRIKPDSDKMREVIHDIERGERTLSDAEKILRTFVDRKITPDEYCHHDHDDDHDHEHPHHHEMPHQFLQPHEH
ncbi:MAG: hypothetical protein P8123_00860 [bacterium]